jgi:hypothetical protein
MAVSVRETLSNFSRHLDIRDFQVELDQHAAVVGIAPGVDYQLDGAWHQAEAEEKQNKGRVSYIGEWRETTSGVRYPRVTFWTFRHGGQAITFDGYQAARRLYSGHCPKPPPPRPLVSGTNREPDYEKNRQRLIKTWRAAFPLDHPKAAPARAYLKYRGLEELVERGDLPAAVRCHPSLSYWDNTDEQPKITGRFPALVACIKSSNSGRAVALHRTYLSPDGRGKAPVTSPKKLMPPTQPNALTGAAIPLYPITGDELAVAEGIETAMAVRLATGLPVWSAVSAFGLKSLFVPDALQHVLICADRDAHGVGEHAAHTLANQLTHAGKHVRLMIPERVGTDWLDVLNDGETTE